MSDLFSAGRPSTFRRHRLVLKAKLTIGDVATGLGLSGSSRDGWDCPVCGAEHSIRETEDHKGGRCRSCGEGFDIVKLVTELEDLTYEAAMDRLSQILDDKSPKPHNQKGS